MPACRARAIGVGVGRTQHHQTRGGSSPASTGSAGEFEAIHPGHVHVEHGKVERVACAHCRGHRLQGLWTAFDTANLHAPALQLLQQDVAVGLVVVDHQHAHAGQRFGQRGQDTASWPPAGANR